MNAEEVRALFAELLAVDAEQIAPRSQSFSDESGERYHNEWCEFRAQGVLLMLCCEEDAEDDEPARLFLNSGTCTAANWRALFNGLAIRWAATLLAGQRHHIADVVQSWADEAGANSRHEPTLSEVAERIRALNTESSR